MQNTSSRTAACAAQALRSRHAARFALHALASAALVCAAMQEARAQAVFSPGTAETWNSTTVQQLNLSAVYARGILGSGIKVAALDSGINLSNPEFAGNARVLAGWNVNGSGDASDISGHGTHVAGIITAAADGSGIYGVAPGATLLPVRIFNSATASDGDINRGLTYAASAGARVVNLSLSATTATGSTGLRSITTTDQVLVVVAAGNRGAADPDWPARYARESWAAGRIVAVGAVDANRQIAAFSNRAGDTANYFLVAPGVNITSSYGSGYGTMSGTSMAAPAVSGAAALVWGYWPYLRASQVSAILLNTADDLGAPGVDAIYGHGMLNVNRALAPIGSFTYRAASGRLVTVPLTQRPVPTSRPKVASPAAFRQLSTQVFDAYGRNFTSDEGDQLSNRSISTVEMLMGRLDTAMDTAVRILGSERRLLTLSARASGVLSRHGELQWNQPAQPLASMIQLRNPGGLGFAAGSGGYGSQALGLMDGRLAPTLAGAESIVANPILGFAPAHRFASLSTPLAGGLSTRLGIVQSKTVTSQDGPSADIGLVEVTYARQDMAINISMANLAERGMLGGYSHGGLGLSQRTGTRGVSVSGAWRVARDWMLAGSYSLATTGAPQAAGLLEGGTTIESVGYGVGLIKSDTWCAGDRLSVMLNAPLRARSGTLVYEVVSQVTEDGEPIYTDQLINLKGSARELMTEARYLTRLSPNAWLTLAAAYRLHPDHDAQARPERIVGMRYALSF